MIIPLRRRLIEFQNVLRGNYRVSLFLARPYPSPLNPPIVPFLQFPPPSNLIHSPFHFAGLQFDVNLILRCLYDGLNIFLYYPPPVITKQYQNLDAHAQLKSPNF
jgi:hypothetical protein